MSPAERDRIVRRIRACLALASSPEPHEAAAALRRAQALFRMPFRGIEDEHDGGFAIVMRPRLIRVEPRFVGRVRGWRYLRHEDAPPDLAPRPDAGDLPADLAAALDELRVG